jgi:hypothetical protein
MAGRFSDWAVNVPSKGVFPGHAAAPRGHCGNRCSFRQALPAGRRLLLARMRLATASARLAPGAVPVSAPVWAAAAALYNPGAALGRVPAAAAALYAGQGRTD